MKRALISPLENNRIAQIASSDFPVAAPFFWVDCPDSADPVSYYFDGAAVSLRQAQVVDPAIIAEAQRISDIDAAIAAASFNGASIASLKAMSRDQFNAWWATNVTNAAQAITVLKWIAWLVIRKLPL